MDYYVYTDGSCINNGKKNAKASIGIYFGNRYPSIHSLIEGKQSNNTAELTAIVVAYDFIKDDLDSGKKIGIVSDSEYAIRCVTSYGEKCDKKDWKVDIPNKELVQLAYTTYKNSTVQFIHINSHTGKQDEHSLGNEEADRLANLALGVQKTNKIYLNVPFKRKEEVKGLGGKWDPSKKKWYIMEDNDQKEYIIKLFENKTVE
jgi:ribonuclease HI